MLDNTLHFSGERPSATIAERRAGYAAGVCTPAAMPWPDFLTGQETAPVRVLLIDDDEFVRRVIAQELLSDLRIQLEGQADSIREGRKLLATHEFDVLMVDLRLSDGMGFGSNTRVALMTRGLAEITRIGVAMGANPLTFMGLSGMGDLVLTCSGDASRNRRVGLALGQGKKMADVLAEMNQVAEGVKTAKVAKQLADKLGVDAPIMQVMHAALHEKMPIRDVVEALLSRPAKGERD